VDSPDRGVRAAPRDESTALLPWLGAITVAALLLGPVTASGCQNLVVLATDKERERTEAAMRARVEAVAREMVVLPTARELADYARFCAELAAVRGRP
jgi:hypothetical protein